MRASLEGDLKAVAGQYPDLRDAANYPPIASFALRVSLQSQAHPAPDAQIELVATGQAQKMPHHQQ